MKKLSFLLFFVSFLFLACNNDEITVTLNQAGTLSVKVVDESQTGIVGAEVFISDFDYGITDGSGVYHTDKLLQRYYECSTTAQVGNIKYTDSKTVYVIAGEDKKVELTPLANVGEINLRMFSCDTGASVKGINFALMDEGYDVNEDMSVLIEKAYLTVKTNSEGVAEFKKVPINTYYHIFAYDDDRTWSGYYYHSVYAKKGDKTSFDFCK